jgi:hypothetical protein
MDHPCDRLANGCGLHWEFDIQIKRKKRCFLKLVWLSASSPIGDKTYQGIAAFCVCVLEYVAHIIHILIMTNIRLIFQMETWNWSSTLKILNHHERKLHLEFGSLKTFNMKRLLCLVQPPTFHQQKLGPEIGSLQMY